MSGRTAIFGAMASALFLLPTLEPCGAESEVRSLGVMPVVVPADAGASGSEFVEELVAVIESREVLRVVSPGSAPVSLTAGRAPQQVRAWSKLVGVDAVVATRVVSTPRGLNLDVQVRMGDSGALVSEFSVDIANGEDVSAEAKALAGLILERLGHRSVSAAPSSEGALVESAELEGDAPELELLKNGDSVAIRSDQLEVTQQDDEGRRLVFFGNVHVTQGDIRLEADRLEAVYAMGSSKPEQLEATGNVEVVQGDRRGRCKMAIYDRIRRQVLCRGEAELVQGCEIVRGSEIQFDLAEERVRVIGAASVVLQTGQDKARCDEGTS